MGTAWIPPHGGRTPPCAHELGQRSALPTQFTSTGGELASLKPRTTKDQHPMKTTNIATGEPINALNLERVEALQKFGYEHNEAEFLCFAALQSGYFLRRQY